MKIWYGDWHGLWRIDDMINYVGPAIWRTGIEPEIAQC